MLQLPVDGQFYVEFIEMPYDPSLGSPRPLISAAGGQVDSRLMSVDVDLTFDVYANGCGKGTGQ